MPYWDKKHETMPLQDLKELQLKRLKNVVRTVYEKNEFYHKKLKDAGVKPDDIKTLEDITNLQVQQESRLLARILKTTSRYGVKSWPAHYMQMA